MQESKFICIVHRGDITGDMYLCPECKALYCQRCAKVLKANKDACWSCTSEIVVSLTESERLELTGVNAIGILHDIIAKNDYLKEALEEEIPFKDVPELSNQEFTLFNDEELTKIDLLELAEDEKREFINDIIGLSPDKRKVIIDKILQEEEEETE